MKTVGIHYHATQTYSQSKESAALEFAAYAKAQGPQPAPKWFTELAPTPGDSYCFRIDTARGPLEVSFYRTWIATRFENFERAKDLLSPHSAKWNFHGEDAESNFRNALANIR